ncbi:Esterase (plasmid) [Mesorhizobium loti]|nr:Esterase [Mesorhizobium loti]
MKTDRFTSMHMIDQANLVRAGQVSSTELVEAAIACMKAVNLDLNAGIFDLSDDARREMPTTHCLAG